jgi:hypothetical protein
MSAGDLIPLALVYDLRDPGAWDEACRHARLWGRLYTDLHRLEDGHVVLVFRPAPDKRWREWERVRLEWILDLHRGASLGSAA